MLRRFEQPERDYPRPAPPMQYDGEWKGCIKIGDNAWRYSEQFFPTEEAALRWAVETVEEIMRKIPHG